jgi:hypothetical protein
LRSAKAIHAQRIPAGLAKAGYLSAYTTASQRYHVLFKIADIMQPRQLAYSQSQQAFEAWAIGCMYAMS